MSTARAGCRQPLPHRIRHLDRYDAGPIPLPPRLAARTPRPAHRPVAATA
ncbi:MAG: hypothetical protein GX442_14435 [Candidatus Riflebacteria bacterium]|nr:hypothetical protein [Candidatus Riflebacteria bacterium]